MSLSKDDQASLTGKQFGFIGIGCMGWHMAMNIAKKITSDSTLTICDIDSERVDHFITAATPVTPGQLQTAKTPKEVAEASVGIFLPLELNIDTYVLQDIILTSLPAAKHVKLVFSDPDTGLLEVSKNGRRRLFLETSTYEVSAALEVEKLV